jgi:hypothetical protein
MRFIMHNIELQAQIDAFGNFSADEFAKLVAVCSASERLLLRYMLAKVFGVEAAAKRFNVGKASLEKDMVLVASALEGVAELDTDAADGGVGDVSEEAEVGEGALEREVQFIAAALAGVEDDAADGEDQELAEVGDAGAAAEDGAEGKRQPSKYMRMKAFHESLVKLHHGGRVAWEKKEGAAAKAMQVIQQHGVRGVAQVSSLILSKGIKIHPSLNDPVSHVVGASLGDMVMELSKAEQRGELVASPSKSALSRAMTRPNGRNGLAARIGVTKKVRFPHEAA